MVNGLDKSKKQLLAKRRLAPRTKVPGVPGTPGTFGGNWRALGIFFLLALLFLSACRQGGLLTKVVARINGEEISLGAFERSMRDQMGYSSQGLGATAAEKQHIKLALLGQLIEEKLLLQEAKKKGLRVIYARKT